MGINTQVGVIGSAVFAPRDPLDDLSSHALQANVLEGKVPGLRQAAVAVTEKNRRHGAMAYPEYASAPPRFKLELA